MALLMRLVVCLYLTIICCFNCTATKQRSCKESDEALQPEKWVLYKGAVVEYAPFIRWTEEGGSRILEENTNAYVSFAHQAKNQDVDILVFPEYGLTGGLQIRKKEPEFISLFQRIPSPKKELVPCFGSENAHTYQALMNLSCTARSLKMYLVVNMAEWYENSSSNDSKNYFYNTQVVLDRKGTVIARYRKKNLFFEHPIRAGVEDPSSALFKTDFGATFTLQIGFDIMNEEPGVHNVVGEGVMNAAMSAAWMDGLPFHTAPQTFSGFSRGLGVNLLVANYHDPDNAGMGSGIFSGLEPFPMSYTYNIGSNARVIVKDIISKSYAKSKDQKKKHLQLVGLIKGKVYHSNAPMLLDSDFVESYEYRTGNINSTYRNVIHQNLENYTSNALTAHSTKTIVNKTVCDGSLCCSATYSFREYLSGNHTYHLIALSGLDLKGGGKIQFYVQKCAVVFCVNEDLDSCAGIDEPQSLENGFRLHSLVGLFDTEFIFPSFLKLDFQLADSQDWDYNKHLVGKWNASIVTKTRLKNILSVSLFARLYEKDPVR